MFISYFPSFLFLIFFGSVLKCYFYLPMFQVELEDPNENIGAKLVRHAAAKANDLAGDGTTTSVVLAQGLMAEGVKVGSSNFLSIFYNS